MTAQGDLPGRLLDFIDRASLDPPFVVLGAVLALMFGAGHALAPGHAKAVGAAYLVGERGSARDAVLLGVVVSAMHTFSVLALALFLYAGAENMEGLQDIGPGLRLAGGAMVLAVGAWMVYRRARHSHDHRHHGSSHPGELPAGVSPLSRRGLVVLGMSGGILPSPTAFLVLVTALFSGRIAFGLLLVTAFSAGMAAALVLFGLGVVWGRDRLMGLADSSSALSRLGSALPVLGAAGVTAGGFYLTVSALIAM